jgi:cullin-associated NEDD8-dissociated protein 1
MGKQTAEVVPLILGAATAHDDDELKEGVLLTLESLVLKCPTETGPFITQIVEAGTSLIKYDPNWAADDDDEEDVEMGEDDEDEDDDFADDDLDDDDVSKNELLAWYG